MPTVNIQVRTEDEIVARVRAIAASDFFGFRQSVLLSYLSVDRVREFCKPDADLSEFSPLPLHAGPITEEVTKYMAFAWGKVEDHRGLSASRSVEKIGEWLWVLGLDDLLSEMNEADYENYGAPQLAVVCRALNLPVPSTGGIQRMIEGLPCQTGCDEGCGS